MKRISECKKSIFLSSHITEPIRLSLQKERVSYLRSDYDMQIPAARLENILWKSSFKGRNKSHSIRHQLNGELSAAFWSSSFTSVSVIQKQKETWNMVSEDKAKKEKIQ